MSLPSFPLPDPAGEPTPAAAAAGIRQQVQLVQPAVHALYDGVQAGMDAQAQAGGPALLTLANSLASRIGRQQALLQPVQATLRSAVAEQVGSQQSAVAAVQAVAPMPPGLGLPEWRIVSDAHNPDGSRVVVLAHASGAQASFHVGPGGAPIVPLYGPEG